VIEDQAKKTKNKKIKAEYNREVKRAERSITNC